MKHKYYVWTIVVLMLLSIIYIVITTHMSKKIEMLNSKCDIMTSLLRIEQDNRIQELNIAMNIDDGMNIVSSDGTIIKLHH